MQSDKAAEKYILNLIKKDVWMMHILKSVKTLKLPDWWVGAGFVRNKVWDVLHEYSAITPINDIDVIFFYKANTTKDLEKKMEKKLTKIAPYEPWSVKNQARLQIIKNDPPYNSSEDGLKRWVETATCIAVKLDEENNLKLLTPYGTSDLMRLIIRKTPGVPEKIYKSRLIEKNWLKKWPNLTIIS